MRNKIYLHPHNHSAALFSPILSIPLIPPSHPPFSLLPLPPFPIPLPSLPPPTPPPPPPPPPPSLPPPPPSSPLSSPPPPTHSPPLSLLLQALASAARSQPREKPHAADSQAVPQNTLRYRYPPPPLPPPPPPPPTAPVRGSRWATTQHDDDEAMDQAYSDTPISKRLPIHRSLESSGRNRYDLPDETRYCPESPDEPGTDAPRQRARSEL